MGRRRQSITPSMRMEIAERHGGSRYAQIAITCTYCPSVIVIDWREGDRVRFRDADGRLTPELDHVDPLALGGPHTTENLVPACMRCNRSKGARRLANDLANARAND